MFNNVKKFLYFFILIVILTIFNNFSEFKNHSNISVVNNNITYDDVYLGGEAIGIKLKSKGLIIVDINANIKNTLLSSDKYDIRIGDIISKINDEEIIDALDLKNKLQSISCKETKLSVIRNGFQLTRYVKLKKNQNEVKIGLWVRDVTSGVGTITFYSKDKMNFAALGHPIIDSDTGIEVKIREGFALGTTIVDIRKGEKGKPGELKGIFTNELNALGKISNNNSYGIYGEWRKPNLLENKKLIKVGKREDIVLGKAYIYSTIKGESPDFYEVEIEKLLDQDIAKNKSMIIKITDDRLLNLTGGIVQGMSGSPIIQDNKIVGAVTHVMVNKPNYGYGIYIEWMMDN